MVVGYHFVLKPRRRAQRLASVPPPFGSCLLVLIIRWYRHILAAKRAQEEDSGAKREREAVNTLLRDAAKRHMQSESAKGGKTFCFLLPSTLLTFKGLIILEATYAPIDKSDRVRDLIQDVTIPLQALVRSSQLHIPGDQPKVRYS